MWPTPCGSKRVRTEHLDAFSLGFHHIVLVLEVGAQRHEDGHDIASNERLDERHVVGSKRGCKKAGEGGVQTFLGGVGWQHSFAQCPSYAGMRSTLEGFMRHANWFTPFYERIDGEAVAYNGSHYTLFLESSMEPPRYPGHTTTLVCESHTTRVWQLD